MLTVTRTTTRSTAAGTARRADRRQIVALAAPMTLASAAGFLLPLVVLALMGRMGQEALYVRSVYTPLTLFTVAVQTACDTTNQVLVARRVGAGRRREAAAAALGVGRVWVGIGLAAALVLAVGAGGLADLLRVDPDARSTFEWFVRAMAVANVGLAWPMLCASCLRGSGHARAAATVTLTTALLQIATVAGLGLAAGLGIAAVPVSVGVAAVISGTLGVILVRRAGLTTPGRNLVRQPEALTFLVRTGLPISLSFLALFAMNLVLVRLLGPFGHVVVAGYAAGSSVQSVVQMPSTMLGSATAIVMNRRIGSDARHRLGPVLSAAVVPALVVSVTLAVVCWAGRVPIGALLTGNAATAAQTTHYLAVVAPSYLVLGLVLAALSVLQQTGSGRLAILLISCYALGTIVLAEVAARTFGTTDAVYAAMAAMNVAGVTVVVLAVRTIRRRDGRATRPGSAEARPIRA